MALTETIPLNLDYDAPDFLLPDVVTGNQMDVNDVMGEKGLVVMFICNHCPYVVHIRAAVIQLARGFIPKGVGFVAISSNDVVKYPDDRPELMRQLALDEDFPFPYLYDESQEVARAYHAACTPDFSVFNSERRCVYRGRFDASTPGNGQPVTGHDLRLCLEQLLESGAVVMPQLPSMGCNIKWKSE